MSTAPHPRPARGSGPATDRYLTSLPHREKPEATPRLLDFPTGPRLAIAFGAKSSHDAGPIITGRSSLGPWGSIIGNPGAWVRRSNI